MIKNVGVSRMRPIKFGVFAMLVLCLVSIPLVARAGEATDQLSATINEFMAILTSAPVCEPAQLLQFSSMTASREVPFRFFFSSVALSDPA